MRRIRARDSRIPVLMLTARGDDVDRIIGLELGADDYVPKPCTPRELVARIRAILRRTQSQESASPPSGPSGAADEEVDLVELVTGIADDARFEAEAHGRQVRFSGEGAATVKVRAELLHRAFENVIRNAVKYTHEGTTVEVRVERRTAPDRLIVTVADRGPGVPESDLPAIFEPFFRGGSSAATAGFGLGLAIARRAIEARGGIIRALNHPGGGLQIEIVLSISERILCFSAAGVIHVP